MQRVKTHQEPLRSELSNDVESEGESYAESENLRWDERLIRALYNITKEALGLMFLSFIGD